MISGGYGGDVVVILVVLTGDGRGGSGGHVVIVPV